MKQYRNATTGEWYREGQTMTRKIDRGTLFSGVPTGEQLSEWGYEEYIPAVHEVTEEERKRQRMAEIQSRLQATDYLALKAYEGEDMSEHPGWKEERAALRAEYRQLESEVSNDV